MKGTFTFTAKTYPKCDEYLRIRWNGEEYKKIEEFISMYPETEEPELDICMVNYRGDENSYNDSWDVKKIMTFCTYEFVVGALKSRGITNVRKLLTSCSGKIEEVRSWANYIKHKGGIDYKDSQAEDPFQIYIAPVESDIISEHLDDRFAIKNFKSPIEIDIDEKSKVILQTHRALCECITKIIEAIDFDKYTLQFGGNN